MKTLPKLLFSYVMNQTVSLYYNETPTTESSVDLVVDQGKIYKRYYSKRNFNSKEEVNYLIEHLVIDLNYTMDKQTSEYAEFVDRQTGNVRYVFWVNNSVEKYYREYLSDAKVDDSLLNFKATPYYYFQH
jgi:hypothetical protein